MKNQFLQLFLLSKLILFAGILFDNVQAQCTYSQVLHTTGTEQVGCSEVTVSSTGMVYNGYNIDPNCQYGPFIIGNGATGSYTFNFSPAISGIKINVNALDNHIFGKEEMKLYINGSFYFLTNSGNPNICYDHAIVSPTGTLIASPLFGLGSASDIDINTSISTLTIEDTWLSLPNPAGIFVSLYICCANCATDAGSINTDSLTFCTNQPAVVPSAEQTILDSDDLLEYILFSDTSNVTGSTMTTSSTPNFYFDPATMTVNTTYYIAAIAGNELNGNVDSADPCWDISNIIEVKWWPIPSVTFTSDGNCVEAGDCIAITANFTGTAPFQLSGRVMSGNNVVSTFSGTYLNNNEVINVCLSANTPLGAVVVEATNLTDGFCSCN